LRLSSNDEDGKLLTGTGERMATFCPQVPALLFAADSGDPATKKHS